MPKEGRGMVVFRLCDAGTEDVPHDEWSRILGLAWMEDVREDSRGDDKE